MVCGDIASILKCAFQCDIIPVYMDSVFKILEENFVFLFEVGYRIVQGKCNVWLDYYEIMKFLKYVKIGDKNVCVIN